MAPHFRSRAPLFVLTCTYTASLSEPLSNSLLKPNIKTQAPLLIRWLLPLPLSWGRQDNSAHHGSRLAQVTQLAALNCRGPEGRQCLLKQRDLSLGCCHYSRCWGVSTMSILFGCVVLSQPGLQSFSIYVPFLQVHPALAGHLNLVGSRGQVSLGTACCVVVYTDLRDLKDILPSLKMDRNVP